MALIEFKNLPDTSTPLNAENLNNNFDYLDDRIDAIGTLYSENFDNSTVTNNTLVNVGTITLPKGKYIITGFGSFSSNSTGYRQMGVATSTTSTSLDRSASATISAANGSTTTMQVAVIVTPNAATTYYLNVKQTSGSSLTFSYGGFRAIKLQ